MPMSMSHVAPSNITRLRVVRGRDGVESGGVGVRLEVDLDGLDPPEGRVTLDTGDTTAESGVAFSGWLELLAVMQSFLNREADEPND
jgi:hypothetical protein